MATLFNVRSSDAGNICFDRSERNTLSGNMGALIGPIHPTANIAPVAQTWREILLMFGKFVPMPGRNGNPRGAVCNLMPSCKV